MARILVCDSIADPGLDILRQAGTVEVRPGLDEAQLAEAAGEADAIVVRSGARITAAVIEAARHCRVIARAGVGVDNIDVPAATRKGVLVVNSPAGNILAAAELTVALLMAAARSIPQACAATKAGQWNRTGLGGRQLQGKALGLVGLGKVGTEVARRARGLGLQVQAHDPYITRERAALDGVALLSLDELLAQSDFVSLHAVATSESEGLIGARELGLMRPGAILINTARGSLVDEAALVSALRSGHLAAAALDVFATEPPTNQELLSLPNLIATPHMGALTDEAQANVALDAAQQVVDVLSGRPPRWPVNVPLLPPETLQAVAPVAPLAASLGRVARALLQGPPRAAELRLAGGLLPEHLGYLTAMALTGLLQGTTDGHVNMVNAHLLAAERQIEVRQTLVEEDRGYTNLLSLSVTGGKVVTVSGALIDRNRPRIVDIDGFEMDLPPVGAAFLIWRRAPSRPGFIGRVGTLLGAAGVNISAIQVSQEAQGEVGLMALAVESDVPESVVAQVQAEDGVVATRVLRFGDEARA